MSGTTFVPRDPPVDLMVYHNRTDLWWVEVEVDTPGLEVENFVVVGGV